jgi:hypothetical protein
MQYYVWIAITTECVAFLLFSVDFADFLPSKEHHSLVTFSKVCMFSPYMLTWMDKPCKHSAFGTDAMVNFWHFRAF